MFKRLTTATLLSGVLIAGAGAVAGSVNAAGAPGAHHRVAARTLGPAAKRHAHRHHRVLRNVLRVTAVGGATIDAVTRADLPVTITVGTATTYREAGKAAVLTDVQPGESILVRGTRTGVRTIQATTVRILFARVAGVVTAVNGSTLTVTGMNGAQHTVTIAATAAITRAGTAATAADITPNTAIVAAGTPSADGSLTAVRIVIRVAHVAGKVTAVDGSTITVQGTYGATYTVLASPSTVYATRQGKVATASTLSAVTTGRRIVAYGTRSADGKTLTAVRIVIGRAGKLAR